MQVEFVGPIEQINPENDNVDVFLHLDDGRTFAFLVATPNNIYWCMENMGVDYFLGEPPVLVQRITKESIEQALKALVETGEETLNKYGTLSTGNDSINPPILMFPQDFDEQSIVEMEWKGWACAAVKLSSGKVLEVYFYDPVRLSQDLETERQSGKACIAESGMIVVPDVTLKNMNESILQLHRNRFFERLVPLGQEQAQRFLPWPRTDA
jgi:hypothetical protein